MKALEYPATHEWHVSINKHSDAVERKEMRFMYEAKTMALEVPRMMKLFKMEREGTLPGAHRQCSHSPVEKIENNHLTCCRGVKCSECPHLIALDSTSRSTPDEIDEMKAWTCATHIVSDGGDMMNEGYLFTVSDRMFWDRLHENLAAGLDAE